MTPITTEHDGITVVRDDLFPGGTKARYLATLYERADEIVYASPQEGGAQTVLAHVAALLGKRATIFVAKRASPHPRVLMAKRLGATIVQVSPGYLSVVHKRAEEYCAASGATLAPFGMAVPQASDAIVKASCALDLSPDEVWCASGSGVLARALAQAWPNAKRFSVQVGRNLTMDEVAGADIIVHPLPFEKPLKALPPFPSDPHYDAKAWEIAKARHGAGLVVYWNVAGPAV